MSRTEMLRIELQNLLAFIKRYGDTKSPDKDPWRVVGYAEGTAERLLASLSDDLRLGDGK